MATPTSTKLHHALKKYSDRRIPENDLTSAHDFDYDASKKPTIAVSKGEVLVYEYKDGTFLVEPAPPLSDHNVDVIQKTFRNTVKIWEGIDKVKERKNRFIELLKKSDKPNIDQVICTGIGSFSAYPPDGVECNAYYQFAEFLDFMEELKSMEKITADAKMFFQDPLFNKIDRDFLATYGIAVIENPEAFNKMSTTTFLYAPNNHDHIFYHSFRVAEPVLLVGNNLAIYGACNGGLNPNNLQ